MSKNILPDCIKSINRQIALEQLAEALDKAEALSEFSVTNQTFLSQKPVTVHHYLCTINTLLIDARRYYNQAIHGSSGLI